MRRSKLFPASGIAVIALASLGLAACLGSSTPHSTTTTSLAARPTMAISPTSGHGGTTITIHVANCTPLRTGGNQLRGRYAYYQWKYAVPFPLAVSGNSLSGTLKMPENAKKGDWQILAWCGTVGNALATFKVT
jgi:hypothetical protein